MLPSSVKCAQNGVNLTQVRKPFGGEKHADNGAFMDCPAPFLEKMNLFA